ncbi:hypothetical protein CDD80_6649 [Ophiocordyceps camponoti-rufipedis]|uniref:Uncharacterized protein n=1 Tax=Ophiocordyceps camponoti-rufipedis TaxID=2004952 RepID=A0A2C5YLC0_9HYPO|nr:hypothetical protein CDD80_6649 [Ophiocordyceps camponoti-rufipedis]
MAQYSLVAVAQQSLSSDAYVLDLRRTTAGLAATVSDQRLTLLDPQRLRPLNSWATAQGNLKAVALMGASLCTAGEDGSVAVWDLRLAGERARVGGFQASASPILALACSEGTQTIAVGTELHAHTASILLWDVRAGPVTRAHYQEVHSDDVTTLAYHPSSPDLLISGSTDGLVNILDTRVADEDEVTLQTLNHDASIHHAGFVSNDVVFALSHDERFSLYDGVALDPQDDSITTTIPFGDVRSLLDCRYVADVTPKTDGTGVVLGAGSQERQSFELVFLTRDAVESSWKLDRANGVALPGAHGDEIVRAFCFFDEEQLVFTAGEDGNVKAWRPNG